MKTLLQHRFGAWAEYVCDQHGAIIVRTIEGLREGWSPDDVVAYCKTKLWPQTKPHREALKALKAKG